MKKRELLKDLEENIYCRLQPSPIHGIGIFAIRDIPRGVNPFRGSREAQWKKFRVSEIRNNSHIPEEVEEFIFDLYPIRNDIIYIPNHSLNAVDISYFLNHGDEPNVTPQGDGNTFVTSREIKKGEELVSNYKTYSDR